MDTLENYKKVMEVIGTERYSKDLIMVVLRHHASQDIHAIISDLVEGVNEKAWLAIEKNPDKDESKSKKRASLAGSSSSPIKSAPKASSPSNSAPKSPYPIRLASESSSPIKSSPASASASAPPYQHSYSLPPLEINCTICTDTFPPEGCYIFDCKESHRYCLTCTKTFLTREIEEGRTPRCPGQTCGHEVSLEEVGHISPKLRDLYDQNLLKLAFQQPGFIQCGKCNLIVQTVNPREVFNFVCPRCKESCCSVCREIYHYRTTCEQLAHLRHIWFGWVQEGRKKYLQEEEVKEHNFQQKVKEHEREKAELQKERQLAITNFEILKQDETLKSQRAKRCPNCRRVVEKLEGCDSMRCGQDAHGGNIQNGCGTPFNWHSAPPYQAEIPDQPAIKEMLSAAPQRASNYLHEHVSCDNCKEKVVGLRFSCLHCPDFNLCSKCENVARHPQTHVFMIMVSDSEALS